MLERHAAASAASSFLAIGALAAQVVTADIRLPALVGSGMVLQRDARINVWGWAGPGEGVRVVFRGKTMTTRADREGRWSVALEPHAAGGPYEMGIRGKSDITLRDILIGDVWLASGQSNMEWPVKGAHGAEIDDSDAEIAEASFPRIRLFEVRDDPSPQPKDDVVSEGWQEVTPRTVGEFSAVAYLFGRELHQRYQVPIGLIQSAVGGTVAEAWTSEAGLKRFPEFRAAIEALARVPHRARADYQRYAERKAAWYEGEGSVDRGRDAWQDPAVEVPAGMAEKPLTLHLGGIAQDDTTYFNGQKVGEIRGLARPRVYTVPAEQVRGGKNILVSRIVGISHPVLTCVGFLGPADTMKAESRSGTIPLAGEWSYAPGPDLESFPVADAITLAAAPSPNTPTVLFNGMINPLTHFRIKGVIWYQGESNASEKGAVRYRALFPALIQDWRRQWGFEFPFLFVQLAGFGPNQSQPAEYPWAELREAQSMSLSLPRTGMATAIDIGDEADIHPRNKQDVAHRLALAAAKVAYGESIVSSGPTFQSMQMEGAEIRLKFSNLGSGLLIRDKYGYGRGFEIAGADGRFHWAQARQDGEDIVVSNTGIRQPVAVRYAWSNTPDGNVFNREGLPAVPFRTAAPDPSP